MFKWLTSIVLILFIVGCSNKEQTSVQLNPEPDAQPQSEPAVQPQPDPPAQHKTEPAVQPETEPAEQIQEDKKKVEDYFPKESQIKYFKGTGNEFATETEYFYKKEGEYLPSIVENGGTRILKIYKITQSGMYLVYEQPEFYEKEVPSISSLKTKFSTPQPILTEPIKEGNIVNGWKIVQINGNVAVPLETLEHVIVLERNNEDGSISRQSWAPGIGLIKKEFFIKDEEGNETVITTELERVENLIN